MKNKLIIKGNIIYTKEIGKFEIAENGYIEVEGKYVKNIFNILPKEYNPMDVVDYNDSLIIPGFVDLHLHAPQFPNIGLGLDKELIPWLETYTFPEEDKYNNINYAKKVYCELISEMWSVGTTRSCIFSTIHVESAKLLMDLLNEAGLGAYVGKVNMDICSYKNLEETKDMSIYETENLLKEYGAKYDLVKPIITPRFVPSCSFELLKELGELAKKYNSPIQSHLDENYNEITIVKKLYPNYKSYSHVYDSFGLLGDLPTIMAHCVLINEYEMELLKRKNVFVAHCPLSNSNLASGIAPIRRMLQRGIMLGLASDISAGNTLFMTKIISAAAQLSNLKWLESGKVDEKLSISELFYLATKGGGKFFGNVGSFESGYEFDALVIDDSNIFKCDNLSIEERLQKFIYVGNKENIKVRYVSGKIIEKPKFK